MTEFGTYLWGVISEGALISFLFWIIVYLTVERTSLYVAIKAGLISEAIGNLPYLAGEGPLGEVSLLMSVVAAAVFVWIILRAGELTALKAVYGIFTTYFALIAVVACAPQ